MTTIASAAPRTIVDLTAAAAEHGSHYGPNAKWHASEFVRRFIESAERAAYAEEDRRTIRERFAAAMTARGQLVSTDHVDLIRAAESGEIEPAYLLAIVPDQYGRISPFAVSVQTDRGSWTSRNLNLFGAVRMARVERERGHRASVHFDLCG